MTISHLFSAVFYCEDKKYINLYLAWPRTMPIPRHLWTHLEDVDYQ